MPVTILITTVKYEKVHNWTTCQLYHLGLNSSPFHRYLEFKILSKRKLPKLTAANTLLRTATRAHMFLVSTTVVITSTWVMFVKILLSNAAFSFLRSVKDLTWTRHLSWLGTIDRDALLEQVTFEIFPSLRIQMSNF